MPNLKISEYYHVSDAAQQSAKYLQEIFEEVDIPRKHARAFFRVCCEENNQITIYYYIKKTLKILGYVLPAHFEKFAAVPDNFDYYCREILRFL